MNEPRRSWFRWLSLGMLAFIAAVAISLIWSGLIPLSRGMQWFGSYIVALLSTLLLSMWVLLFSGLRWYVRLLTVASFPVIVGGVTYGLIGSFRFNGDMEPAIRWRWQADPEQEVESHRRNYDSVAGRSWELTKITESDWPEYRGAQRDGVIRGPKLERDWKAHPPKLLWRQPCGLGWSSFAVVGDFAVTMEQRKENEVVVAYDVVTGNEIWKYEHAARFDEIMGGIGPRSTPTIAHGNVHSLGADGHLACLDGQTGKAKWTKNILEGTENLRWAMAGSPLVVGNLVIVNPGNHREAVPWSGVMAFDCNSGSLVWKGGWTKAGYSSPMRTTIHGVEQVVLFDGKQVAGFDLKSGNELWQFPWASTQQDINVAQPIVFSDGRVFISSGYTRGCALLQTKHSQGTWEKTVAIYEAENKPLRCKFTSPVAFGDYIYGLDEGILACIRAKDGKLQWRDGRYGHGQVLRWEDRLIVSTERGDLVLVAADPNEHKELGRVKAITSDRCWNVPAVANGRILVRNEREMACFDLRETKP
jgi:outer membrane protein assembly factor BamB